jgi:hypothetical protein
VLVNPAHILGLSVPRWVLCVRVYVCICVVDPGCVVYTSLVTALVSIGWKAEERQVRAGPRARA